MRFIIQDSKSDSHKTLTVDVFILYQNVILKHIGIKMGFPKVFGTLPLTVPEGYTLIHTRSESRWWMTKKSFGEDEWKQSLFPQNLNVLSGYPENTHNKTLTHSLISRTNVCTYSYTNPSNKPMVKQTQINFQ